MERYPDSSRGLFSFDLMFASLAVLLTLLIGQYLLTGIINSIGIDNVDQENQLKLLLISNKLVRKELALHLDGSIHSNVIDVSNLKIALSDLVRYHNLSSISLSMWPDPLEISISSGEDMSGSIYCIRRLVLIDQFHGSTDSKVGYLDVCI